MRDGVVNDIFCILRRRDHLSLEAIQAESVYAPSIVASAVKGLVKAGQLRQVEDEVDHDWVYALVGA